MGSVATKRAKEVPTEVQILHLIYHCTAAGSTGRFRLNEVSVPAIRVSRNNITQNYGLSLDPDECRGQLLGRIVLARNPLRLSLQVDAWA